MKRALILLCVIFAGVLAGCGGGSGGNVGPPPPPTLVSIVVATTTPSIAPTTTAQFTATGKFSDNSTQNLTTSVSWTSSSPAVATISNTSGTKGVATGVSGGATTITASSGSVSGTGTLNVSSATLNSLTVTPTSPSIDVGTQQQFTATGNFSDGTEQDISNLATWSSSATECRGSDVQQRPRNRQEPGHYHHHGDLWISQRSRHTHGDARELSLYRC